MIKVTRHDTAHQCDEHCNHAHSPTQADLYTALNGELLASPFGGTASEAHGLAAGLCCRAIQAAQLAQALDPFGLGEAESGEVNSAFGALLEIAARDLSSTDFAFDLWLPESNDLNQLTPALGQWCHGFLLGFCFDGDSTLNALSADDQETVNDIIAISGALTESDDDDEALAFMEVREYVRMAVQNLFETLNPDAQAFPDAN